MYDITNNIIKYLDKVIEFSQLTGKEIACVGLSKQEWIQLLVLIKDNYQHCNVHIDIESDKGFSCRYMNLYVFCDGKDESEYSLGYSIDMLNDEIQRLTRVPNEQIATTEAGNIPARRTVGGWGGLVNPVAPVFNIAQAVYDQGLVPNRIA